MSKQSCPQNHKHALEGYAPSHGATHAARPKLNGLARKRTWVEEAVAPKALGKLAGVHRDPLHLQEGKSRQAGSLSAKPDSRAALGKLAGVHGDALHLQGGPQQQTLRSAGVLKWLYPVQAGEV